MKRSANKMKGDPYEEKTMHGYQLVAGMMFFIFFFLLIYLVVSLV